MTDVKCALKEIEQNFNHLQSKSETIEKIAQVWIDALAKGNKVIFCGNGGSAADSQHLVAELMGRYKFDREPLPAITLTSNISNLTAISNDISFEKVFSRQLKAIGKKGDVLVGITTSGNSQNILDAFFVAKENGIMTVAFTGTSGGEIAKVADLTLNVPSNITNSIQEMHIACGHIICGIVEEHFFGKKN